MQHLAFRVDNADELIAMRDRIRTKGVNVIGPLDHGMCQSIYFAGPDNMALEVACPGSTWMRRNGSIRAFWKKPVFHPKEAENYMQPDDYAGEKGAVAQPAYDAAKPHMPYPRRHIRKCLKHPMM